MIGSHGVATCEEQTVRPHDPVDALVVQSHKCLMALGAAAIFLVGRKRTEDEETDGILHGIVPLIAACSYFAMATHQGAIPLLLGAEEATRDFYFARYVDWAFTTPILLYALYTTSVHRAHRRHGVMFGLLAADVLMVLTALFFGATETPWIKWTWFTISSAAFLAVYYVIWGPLRAEARLERDDVRSTFLRNASILSVLWFIYPVILAVGPRGRIGRAARHLAPGYRDGHRRPRLYVQGGFRPPGRDLPHAHRGARPERGRGHQGGARHLASPHRGRVTPCVPSGAARPARSQGRAALRALPAGTAEAWARALLGGAALALLTTAVLPQGLSQVAVLAVVILFGVPHRALDGEVARPFLRPRFGPWWFLAFAVPHLTLAGAVLLAWRLAPLLTLAGFLAASVWHFGEEEADAGCPLGALVLGGLPIAAPVLLQPVETARLLGTVADVALATSPVWLLAAAWSWAALALAWLAFGAPSGRVVAEAAALLAAFAVLWPLTAFALYFVGLHAPRHMRALAADPARAPRVGSLGAAMARSLPVTGLTLLLGALLWPLYQGQTPERLLALTLQGLAALTLPHMVLDALVSRALRGNP